MTKEEKERKIKLILLIILVESEKIRRGLLKTPLEVFDQSVEMVFWFTELHKLTHQTVFKMGGHSVKLTFK